MSPPTDSLCWWELGNTTKECDCLFSFLSRSAFTIYTSSSDPMRGIGREFRPALFPTHAFLLVRSDTLATVSIQWLSLWAEAE